jgi:50S ribosomal subunit-associated GTPase HflX
VGDGFIFLVGNKIDREFREVTQEEALEKANRLGLPYFEISAKTGEHVEDLFIAIIEQQTDKKIASTSFLPVVRQNMRPVEVVKEEREEKEEEEGRSNVEDTGAKISEEQTTPV